MKKKNAYKNLIKDALFVPGFYYNESANTIALVNFDKSLYKLYLGGTPILDKVIFENSWYKAEVYPIKALGWEYIGV